MTVRVNKGSFNIREKLTELGRRFGLKGSELAAANTTQEARDLVSAGRRTLIINGAMRVSQRGTQLTNQSGTGYKTIDRMRYSQNNMGSLRYTHEQDSDAPEGFSKSFKYTVTTVEGNDPTTTEAIRPMQYRIEGQDLQHLKWGTSSAEHVTLSFWVKSSVTGQYSIQFRIATAGTDRLLTRTYTINTTNAWEYKTITIPGDPNTTIIDDNTNRLTLTWCVSSGPDNKSTDSTSWGNYVLAGSHYGQEASLQNTSNATWQITGIQLEVGKNATEFEHRPYGEELALCQRYYTKIIPGASNIDLGLGWIMTSQGAIASIPLPTTMRISPSALEAPSTGLDFFIGYQNTTINVTGLSYSGASPEMARVVGTLATSATIGQGIALRTRDVNAYVAFSTEL